jgi:DNA-binding response OmpR family regulator
MNKVVILAIDDTPESLALLDRILTPAGYQVLPADSGELALAAAAINPPDLILLDVRMKGMDGLEVCRRLKAAAETKHIPIILVSAFADVKEWVKGLQMGVADYISKPFQPEELLMRVSTHLALSRANVSLEKQKTALHQTDEQLQSEIVKRQRVRMNCARVSTRPYAPAGRCSAP